MKGKFLIFILSIILAIPFSSTAFGQQTNIHVSMPPLIDPDKKNAKQISASYIKMQGETIDLNGIDINSIFKSGTSDYTIGAAFLSGKLDTGTPKRDFSGVVFHSSFNQEFLTMITPSSSHVLFIGVPLTLGNFTIEYEEDVTIYNLMAGIQGGARLDFKMDDFKSSPWVMLNLMGGYAERYDGGVYYENLHSKGVPIFAVISSGLEILYLPLNLKLSGIYQRTFESGDNKAMDTVMIELGFNF